VIGYQNDLAYIHDAGFGYFALEAAPGLLRILRRHKITTGPVVDLGCGSGLWARELLQAGYSVCGYDISPDMIRRARRAAPRGRFEVASLFDVTPPKCKAVTVLSEVINYAFDRRNSHTQVKSLFRRLYKALEPGGVLLIDFAEPGQIQTPKQSFWEGEDWAVLLEAHEDHRRRQLTRDLTCFVRHGKNFRRSDETHVLKLYDVTSMDSALKAAGFLTQVHRAWGSWRLPPAHAAVIARKPPTS